MMNSRSWGIDVGSTGVKAVEITHTWRGPRVTNYGFFPFSGKAKDDLRREKVQRLKEILPKLEGGGEGVVLPLASHRTMVHRVLLPFEDRKRNEQVVKFEVESLLPFPIDQVVVDFYGPGKDRRGKDSLVFAVQKEDLGEYLSLTKDAGLDPEVVIPEALALFCLVKNLGLTFRGRVSSTGQTGALLDLGHEKTTLIVWRGDSLALVRSIPIARVGLAGEDPVEEKGSSAEGEQTATPVLRRIAEEVKRTLVSYEYSPEGGPVGNIFITGGCALQPGVENILGESLQKPVAILELGENPPSRGRGSSTFFGAIPKEYHGPLAVALGAALEGTASDRVNLRKEEFSSSRKAKKAKTRAKLLVTYALILVVLGMGSFSLDLYLKERRYQELKGDIRKEFTQAAPETKKVVNEIQQMKARVREEKARLDSLGGSSGAGSPLEIMRELSLMVEPAWKVRVTELIIEPDTVEVNGEAGSFDAVNQLKARLDRSSLYKEVQLKTARASSLDNVIEFKLQMKRGA